MFHPELSIEKLNKLSESTMVDHIGIVFTEIGKNYITAEMPVDQRTVQPYRILHGGASLVLAETLASVASNVMVDNSKYSCIGIEINANHIKSVKEGRKVTGKALPVHMGKKTHVWSIEIRNQEGQLVCISRITIAILDKKTGNEGGDKGK